MKKYLWTAMMIISVVILEIGLSGCWVTSEPPATVVSMSEEDDLPTASEEDGITATQTPAASNEPSVGSSPAVDREAIISSFTLEGNPVYGDPEAPVLIEEFSSYQCPYCARHFEESYPKLIAEYVESGYARYVFHDFPLTTQPQAMLAAEAARCVASVASAESFWKMHAMLFEKVQEWSGKSTAEDIFVSYASQLGVDELAFSECLSNHSMQEAIEEDMERASIRGVRGTPAFFVNDQPLIGLQRFEAFAQLIDPLIVAAGGAVAERPTATVYPTPTPATLSMIGETRVLGSDDASVTIVEFSDYQCPYCASYFSETLSQIKVNLVETGRVRYVFKDFPLTSIHPQALLAHQAARCAGDQNAYWGMHDMLYERQSEWSGNIEATAIFNQFARELGLDASTFASCVSSGRWESAVIGDLQEGANAGVTGTPAFFIDGFLIPGVQQYELFEYAVGLAEQGTLGDAFRPVED